jgi:hypothetical protein
MVEQAYSGEALMAQLDGARLVRYDTAGVVFAPVGHAPSRFRGVGAYFVRSFRKPNVR